MRVNSPNTDTFSKKKNSNTNELINFSIAPMLDWTDRYCRFFFRQLSRYTLLYTEMLTTGALLHNNPEKFLDFHPEEHPIALQLGGSDPKELSLSVKIADEWEYDQINLNVGCPSNRVKKGNFGACLMQEPQLVADCVQAMGESCNRPITIKHRIGIDNKDSYDDLCKFVEIVRNAGCRDFIVHARKAILGGLSPKQNREIPPLNYNFVYKLKNDFPSINFIINGGLKSISEIKKQYEYVDGVMIGREAYHNPWIISEVDNQIFGADKESLSRKEVIERMMPYIEDQAFNGTPIHQITRHMMGLYKGMPKAKFWRKNLSLIGKNKTRDVNDLLKIVSDMSI
tara:strand:- start:16483 stop:17505 length:1023 start_codon:yes stop_codon:yes gene_type:complete